MKNTKPEDGGYVPINTKISAYAFMRLKKLAKKKDISLYDIGQMVYDTLIRYMDDKHNLTPEMERAMSIFEHMVGWKEALTLCDPITRNEIGEAVYFLYDTGEGSTSSSHKKGTRAVHVTRPAFGDWEQDVNIQHIIERVLQLIIPVRYRRMRMAMAELGFDSMLDFIDHLINKQISDEDLDELRKEFEDADRGDFGQKPYKGVQYKRAKNATPDMFESEQVEEQIKTNEKEEEHGED